MCPPPGPVALDQSTHVRTHASLSTHPRPSHQVSNKGREGKGREGKGREGKGREGKGREGKGRAILDLSTPNINLLSHPYT